jgi:hypothetical protein
MYVPMKNVILFLSFAFVWQVYSSCSPGGDYTKELSGGYFFRCEGSSTNDILPHTPNKREIPANVISYAFNKDFIIALQKPNELDDPLYEGTPQYSYGRDTTYYWLIVHAKNQVVGPLNQQEYETALIAYKVPQSLRLKAAK